MQYLLYCSFILITLMTFSTPAAHPQTFLEFIAKLSSAPDSLTRFNLIENYLSHRSVPVIEGEKVHFLYRGKGKVVAVPGEMNRWSPLDAVMERVTGTNLFYRTYTIPLNGRVEYKIWGDSVWTLDPLNMRKAQGGYGENSDLWMPEYRESSTIQFKSNIPRGKIDTLYFSSKFLKRKRPVFVYTPPETHQEAGRKKRLPTLYVTDGGEYLSLGKMHTIIDNLLAEKRIRPVLGVFIDPRIDVHNSATSKRMIDYAASEKFLDFLEKELTPFIEKKFPAAQKPTDRLIMGASMGGLISTYAVLKRNHFITNCAAQSPAYFQADSAVIKLAKKVRKTDVRISIDTGTINDTEIEARLVRQMLEDRGVRVRYAEFPEGHNWTNWRARIGDILEYFFPAQ